MESVCSINVEGSVQGQVGLALSSLVEVPMVGDWNEMSFQVLSNPGHSMILCLCSVYVHVYTCNPETENLSSELTFEISLLAFPFFSFFFHTGTLCGKGIQSIHVKLQRTVN